VNKYWARLREQTWHSARDTNLMKQLRGRTRARRHSTPTQRPDRGPGLTQIKASSTLETASASTPWASLEWVTRRIKCTAGPRSTAFLLMARMPMVAREEALTNRSITTSLILPYSRPRNRAVHLVTLKIISWVPDNHLSLPHSGRARHHSRVQISSRATVWRDSQPQMSNSEPQIFRQAEAMHLSLPRLITPA